MQVIIWCHHIPPNYVGKFRMCLIQLFRTDCDVGDALNMFLSLSTFSGYSKWVNCPLTQSHFIDRHWHYKVSKHHAVYVLPESTCPSSLYRTYNILQHFSNVTWKSLNVESMPTGLFVQQFNKANLKKKLHPSGPTNLNVTRHFP